MRIRLGGVFELDVDRSGKLGRPSKMARIELEAWYIEHEKALCRGAGMDMILGPANVTSDPDVQLIEKAKLATFRSDSYIIDAIRRGEISRLPTRTVCQTIEHTVPDLSDWKISSIKQYLLRRFAYVRASQHQTITDGDSASAGRLAGRIWRHYHR